MATPVISCMQLDSAHNPLFDPSVALTGTAAVAQNILTRLNLWLGEWWENLNLGLPVLQTMLAHSGSAKTQSVIALAIQAQIQATPYVTAVSDIQVQLKAGQFEFTCTVQTAFGTVTVSNAPGAAAIIGA